MATNPSPATLQFEFEQAVAHALHLWSDLTDAVQNNWGGPESSAKRDWFAGAVTELFTDISKLSPSELQQLQHTQQAPPSRQNGNGASSEAAAEEPDQEYVEEFLLNVMLDEFETSVEDDSQELVAEQIIRARAECLRGKLDGVVAELRRKFQSKKPNAPVQFQPGEDEDGEEEDWATDDDDEDADSDDEMAEAAPELVNTKKEKKEPEVDEDGFTMVSRRK